MANNYTILEQNILFGIATEEGKEIFLRGKDRDILKAEKCAWEWDIVYGFMSDTRTLLEKLYSGKAVGEIMEFMKERQFRRYFPQGRNN
jgi:hypothetical protein